MAVRTRVYAANSEAAATRPLSPWERVRERAKRKSSRKRRLKKMATQKYALPKPPKEKHKNNCCQIRFRRPVHIRLLTAYPLDFRADFAEFFLDVFGAAVEVVDAFDDGFAAGDQACHDEAGGGAQIGRHHVRAV